MIPEARPAARPWTPEDYEREGWLLGSKILDFEELRSMLRQAAAAERALRRLTAKGLDVRVLVEAYDWDFHTQTGEVFGLTAGDQGFEPTGLVISGKSMAVVIHDQKTLTALGEWAKPADENDALRNEPTWQAREDAKAEVAALLTPTEGRP